MRTLLLLAHRFPYPPDRGEKIRLWHVLGHLARSHRVFLGCLVDDARDWAHRPRVAELCAGLGCFPLDRRRQKLRALARLRPGRPLMLQYYDRPELHRWVAETAAREPIDAVYVFSTAMAPYARGLAAPCRILDMVDVDSQKWAEYARNSGGPARLVWAREARTLLAEERRAARAFDHTLLVTEAECRRFAELAPESRERVSAVENGVDLAFFAPSGPESGREDPDPYPAPGPWVILVGNMDYPPNDDAARWFAQHVLPRLRAGGAAPRFAVAGANPSAALRRLGGPHLLVTGRVDDVRPWLAHAAVVVAPLRIARGVQNKVLEGMAMGRPVVASPQAFAGIRAVPGRDLLVAEGAEAMAAAVAEVLDGGHAGMGGAARRAMQAGYSWEAQLGRLDRLLDHRRVA